MDYCVLRESMENDLIMMPNAGIILEFKKKILWLQKPFDFPFCHTHFSTNCLFKRYKIFKKSSKVGRESLNLAYFL